MTLIRGDQILHQNPVVAGQYISRADVVENVKGSHDKEGKVFSICIHPCLASPDMVCKFSMGDSAKMPFVFALLQNCLVLAPSHHNNFRT